MKGWELLASVKNRFLVAVPLALREVWELVMSRRFGGTGRTTRLLADGRWLLNQWPEKGDG